MGTIVTIQIVRDDGGAQAAIDRAFDWFRDIEARCTKFHEDSELRRVCARVGVATPASPIVFEAVRFALAVAEDTGGAFDPTTANSPVPAEDRISRAGRGSSQSPGYRDVEIDADARTIMLRRALTIDLGAVAKGLAVDAAARELRPFGDFAIDAGGDLYLGGRNPDGDRWTIGIRHPREDGAIFDRLRVSDAAVCTSGDYERPGHIVDPRSSRPQALGPTIDSPISPTHDSPYNDRPISVSVVAPGAMLADALGTAAFVLGPTEGLRLFERHGVEGLIVTARLEVFETRALPRS
jgi:thiamine biosynthesis lipoprotein